MVYYDYLGVGVCVKFLFLLEVGNFVVYVSEVGMFLIVDSGYYLFKEVVEVGYFVIFVSGVFVVISVLILVGLLMDVFFFEGFLLNVKIVCCNKLDVLCDISGILVFYESLKCLVDMFVDVVDVFGVDRLVVVCCEIIKKFEEIKCGLFFELV